MILLIAFDNDIFRDVVLLIIIFCAFDFLGFFNHSLIFFLF